MRTVNVRNEKCDVRVHRRKDGIIPNPPEECCLGNPFYLDDVRDDIKRAKVIEQYKNYFYNRLKEQTFKDYVHSLINKETFGCFCAPKACHADIIIEYLQSIGEIN